MKTTAAEAEVAKAAHGKEVFNNALKIIAHVEKQCKDDTMTKDLENPI